MNYIIEILPSLLSGLEYTLKVFMITLIISLPLGALVALGRVSHTKLLNQILSIYITIMRGTPLLLQIIFINYGLPYIGIVFTRLNAVLIAFILNYAAYFAEIFRGGIQSIDSGQYEAAKATGISRMNTLRYIIYPQVIRQTITSISNEVITLVKDTSLIYVVGIGELLRAANIASNRDATLVPFILAGLIYLFIILILTKILRYIEKRYQYNER